MQRVVIGLALALSMVLAGCFGDGEVVVTEESVASIWTEYERVDKESHVDERMFVTVDLRTNESTNTTWAVFDATYGGNCCEHYLATSIEGQILNIGGEYPVFSDDRGHVWDTYIPGALPDAQCRTFVPTNPGTEGLGEGSIVQATNGDIISMSWFPYVGGDLKLDKFYAILYDESEGEWKWCYNRCGRSTTGHGRLRCRPISGNIGSGEWATSSCQISGKTQNAGGQIGVDRLKTTRSNFPAGMVATLRLRWT